MSTQPLEPKPTTPILPNHGHMQLGSMGAVVIELTPHKDNPNVFSVDIGAENRIEALNMTTQPNETVDMFINRLRGMLKALWQSEHRKPVTQEKPRAQQGPPASGPTGAAKDLINRAKALMKMDGDS